MTASPTQHSDNSPPDNSGADSLPDIAALHPGELAQLYQSLDDDRRQTLLRESGARFNAAALAWLDESLVQEVAETLGAAKVARALSEMDSDDALAVFEDLAEDFRDRLFVWLSPATRGHIRRGLQFAEGTAGRIMQSEVPVAPQTWNVGQTIDWMRSFRKDLPTDFYELIVVDPRYHPVGRIPLSRILKNRRATPLTELTETRIHPIAADTSQEAVANLFKRYALVSAPVVDGDGRLLGAVTADDIFEVIEEELQQDLLKLVGLRDAGLFGGLSRSMGSRLPWLAVNFLTVLLAAAVIDAFSGTIERYVALAALLPVVASIGGNAGTQSLAVAVRGLATETLERGQHGRFLRREILISFANGVVMAVLAGGLAGFWFDEPRLGLVVGVAMVANLFVAGLAGGLVPIVLQRIGADPAVSASVFVTTATDIAGFFVLLGLASVVFL
ncbi:MAG: magnesium transporter [Alphaproteobacteria bacterium]|nr:magnesium transporter [Alphaproteobacteria bacterium]MDA7983706.1 magnesium transporter [Alphaproteobacteria bacterium]MDA7989237.1 magnesium transporter [Alphaproteobacteria bacterium]MDA8010208.1 magnesium transporter [Alphaproteobacteria bacterium]MDA8030422.1 magnesium transporter [Alphaproteobacteria bacterium]